MQKIGTGAGKEVGIEHESRKNLPREPVNQELIFTGHAPFTPETHPVEVLQRIRKVLKEDVLSFLPGSGYPFTVESFLRLLLYSGLILFIVFLFLSRIRFRQSDSVDPQDKPPLLETTDPI